MEEKNKEQVKHSEGGEAAQKSEVKEVLESKNPNVEFSEDVPSELLKEKIENDISAGQVKQYADDTAQLPEDRKIQNLVEIAREKGIEYAVAVAKKMNSPFVLDRLHDELAKDKKNKM